MKYSHQFALAITVENTHPEAHQTPLPQLLIATLDRIKDILQHDGKEVFQHLDTAGIPEIKSRIVELESAVRKHRDAKGHDRCWENDLELYRLLPETPPTSPQLPSREEFMEGRHKYYEGQCKS